MKICPKCGKTYNDESLNFCLDDGSMLNQTFSGNDMPATVLINQPRATDPVQTFGNQTPQQNWATPVQVGTAAAKKGSRTWLWVAGILGAVVLLCGGGLGGLLLLGSMADDDTKWNSNFATNYDSKNSTPSNSSSNSSSTKSDGEITKIDLSAWVRDSSQYGKTEFRDNEFFMHAIKNNFYYVLVAPAVNKSYNSTTKVSLRDAESGNNSLGYGLIINSNPIPLIKDYAFLINTKTLKYRIVSHTPGNEKAIVNWKSSTAIKSGSQENVLEVQDSGGQFKFFINGELVETLSSRDSYTDGVPGIYVGGTSPVAFSNLEIRK